MAADASGTSGRGAGLRVYRVGGAVRDALLGLPVRDHDWVVVGATPEEMLRRGFRAVGADFPVFLDPDTGEEWALARTERKTAPGYRGFAFHAAPGVTLEDDLRRRDLTINAMAQAPDGTLADPFGGRADLEARVLRHVGEAFAEDPVRILRLARFAARFTEFSVADETLALCAAMVRDGEADHLVPERVWQELSRGLMEARPSRMFEVLRACGALARVLPELDRLWGVPQRAEHHPEVDTGVHAMMVIDMAARLEAPLPARFAALVHDLGKGTTPQAVLPRHIGHEQRSVAMVDAIAERLRVPLDCRDLGRLVAREHGNVHRALELTPATLVRLVEAADALRRPQRLEQMLLACEADHRGRLGFDTRPYPQAARIRLALAAVRTVPAAGIAARHADAPSRIPEAIRQARIEAVRRALPREAPGGG